METQMDVDSQENEELASDLVDQAELDDTPEAIEVPESARWYIIQCFSLQEKRL